MPVRVIARASLAAAAGVALACGGGRSSARSPPAPGIAHEARAQTVDEARADARKAAYAAKDFATFVKLSRQDAERSPDSPRALYNLARAYALNGRASATVDVLDVLVSAQVYFDVAKDADFAAVTQTPEFVAVRARFEALKAPLVASSVAFTLRDRDLLTEGIAHDADTGAFFVSAVHARKIVRVDRDGAVTDFATRASTGDALLGVLGIAVDAKRRVLIAATAGVDEMDSVTDATRGIGAVVELDLDSGVVRRRVALVDASRPRGGATTMKHTPGDLALDARGDAFVTDSAAGAVYTLPVGETKLTEVVPAGTFASPQGIVAFANGSLLVADYARGLYRIDRVDAPGGAARAVVRLAVPDGVILAGIDGLAARGRSGEIIATQNGVEPPRVVKLTLDPRAMRVVAASILERNNPLFAEPTLGVVVGDDYFFIARSQWARFDPKAKTTTPREEPVVLKLRLGEPERGRDRDEAP